MPTQEIYSKCHRKKSKVEGTNLYEDSKKERGTPSSNKHECSSPNSKARPLESPRQRNLETKNSWEARNRRRS